METLRQALDGRGQWQSSVSVETARTILGLSEARGRLLRLISRMDVTSDQAARLFNDEVRTRAGFAASDSEILSNPYAAFEADLDADVVDAIGF